MDNPAIFQKRRAKLLEEINDGLVILPSYTNKTMSNDVHYEFRQQSDLLYFSGFPEPDALALITKMNGEVHYTLFVPERDPEFEIWNGRRYGTEGAIERFGADEAFILDKIEVKLLEALKNVENVYYPMGENEEYDNLVMELIQKAIKSRDKKGKGPVNLVNPLYEFHKVRASKQEDELELIQKAADISAEAMTIAMEVTKPGLTERQIEAVIEYHYAKNKADRPAYPSIVGTGVNATILHYIENTDTLKEGELLLIDAGCEYQGYAADITRTWPVNGTFTSTQKELYELVLDVQKKCIEKVKPGETIQSIHDYSVRLLTEGFVEFGLLEGNVEQLIEDEDYKRFYMHTIGHYLGIDVHDTGALGRETEFQPGYYVTIEPGVYIPDEEDINSKYRGIGIRIEDDILVTENGAKVLTDNVVKEVEDIEKIVGTKELP